MPRARCTAYFSGVLELSAKLFALCVLETMTTLNSSGNKASPAVKTAVCNMDERLEYKASLCTLLESSLTAWLYPRFNHVGRKGNNSSSYPSFPNLKLYHSAKSTFNYLKLKALLISTDPLKEQARKNMVW